MAMPRGITTNLMGRDVVVTMGMDKPSISEWLKRHPGQKLKPPVLYLGMTGQVVGAYVVRGSVKLILAIENVPNIVEVYATQVRLLREMVY